MPRLFPQRPIKAITQSKGGIFYRMMLVYFQITFYVNGQIHAAMFPICSSIWSKKPSPV